MSKSRRSRNVGSARRGVPRPEVGSFVDAVEFGLAEAHPRALALCRQAHRALEAAFSEIGSNETAELETLTLLEVVPDPTIRRLRIWLGAPRSASPSERDAWIDLLIRRRGFLRGRVAEAIHRKRAPHLVFEVVFPFETTDSSLPYDEGGAEQDDKR